MTKKIIITSLIGLLAVTANAQSSATQESAVIQQGKNSFMNPASLFDASKNGFSHIGIKAKEAELVFISGQWASDTTGNLAVEDFAQQVAKSIDNLKKALSAAGLTERDIIKLTIYIVDYSPEKKLILLQTAAPLLEIKCFPTSVIVPVPVLATHPESLIEIEAIATK
jgi:enamine deaminase RidA (YjgF/YER057c/UK114 family)